jgi:hypothetical protein
MDVVGCQAGVDVGRRSDERSRRAALINSVADAAICSTTRTLRDLPCRTSYLNSPRAALATSGRVASSAGISPNTSVATADEMMRERTLVDLEHVLRNLLDALGD